MNARQRRNASRAMRREWEARNREILSAFLRALASAAEAILRGRRAGLP